MRDGDNRTIRARGQQGPAHLETAGLAGAIRVPSGNSSGQRPSIEPPLTLPHYLFEGIAPLLRSMGIMRSSASPQPKQGTQCNSRL